MMNDSSWSQIQYFDENTNDSTFDAIIINNVAQAENDVTA